ncbi:polyprenyl synthetase family protein [Kitasatospora purpeofusca]|uniref:polyprenyl synthetase family protein n=1 Tax=Kitasatospora purpeofusca TaxID=67352 RepID=UPI0036AA6D89
MSDQEAHPVRREEFLGALLGDRGAAVGDVVLPLLREAVEGLHPDLSALCGYHFGWRDVHGRPTGKNGAGKLVRARITVLAAAAVGTVTAGGDAGRDAGTAAAAAGTGAVAVELVHNYSLLHDDIVDADERRRGRPAAWAAFGAGQAILAGDALTALAVRQLAEVPGEAGRRAVAVLVGAMEALVCGQAADTALEHIDPDEVTFGHYFDATPKTTALMGACAETGALLGGADAELAAALRQAVAAFGLAWQISNDVDDIWADPARTGKGAFGDLRAGKRTIPVIAALRSGTEEGSRLRSLLLRNGPVPAVSEERELRAMADLVEAAGGRRYAEALAERHVGEAVDGLGSALPPSVVRDELTGLFRRLVRTD